MILILALRSHGVDNTLTSPQVVVPNGELCLLVVFHTDDSQDSDLLSASVVDIFQNELALGVFHTNEVRKHLFILNLVTTWNLQLQFVMTACNFCLKEKILLCCG